MIIKHRKWQPIAVVAGVFLAALALPSAAFAANANSISVDCNNLLQSSVTHWVLPAAVNVSSTNCTNLVVGGSSVGGTSTTISESTITAAGGAGLQVDFVQSGSTVLTMNLLFADTNVTNLAPLALNQTVDMTIPATSPTWLYSTTTPLGGFTDCDIQASPNPSVFENAYTTSTVTASEAGNYTFRVTSTSPDTDQNAITAGSTPIQAPMLVLYSSFDPSNPGSNIVACNPYRGVSSGVDYLDNGTVLSGNWSQIDTTLQPGTYTLVLMTQQVWLPSTWAADTSGVDQAATVQVWGPPAASPSSSPATTLASTGADMSLMPISISAIVLGAFAILVVIRRRKSDTTN